MRCAAQRSRMSVGCFRACITGLKVGTWILGGAAARADNVQHQRWTRFVVGMRMAE